VKGILEISGLLEISGPSAPVLENGSTLLLRAKTGIDGSGSHAARHQMVEVERSLAENPHLDPKLFKNYLLTCFCPLELSVVQPNGSTVIWKNDHPNSLHHTRPISLIRAQEDREVIAAEFSPLFDEIQNSLKQVIVATICFYSGGAPIYHF
jgi:hypothetical protein